MSLSAKRESLARIHGRYQRAGRPHKTRILDEFCATCDYHRKSALRLLHRPLAGPGRARPGPKRTYDPAVLLPVLKMIWLASDQLCSKLLRAALPEWLGYYERQHAPLADEVKEKLRAISPAQIDRLLRPARVGQTKKGLSTTRPGTLLRHQVPPQRWPSRHVPTWHCGGGHRGPLRRHHRRQLRQLPHLHRAVQRVDGELCGLPQARAREACGIGAVEWAPPQRYRFFGASTDSGNPFRPTVKDVARHVRLQIHDQLVVLLIPVSKARTRQCDRYSRGSDIACRRWALFCQGGAQ